MNSSAMSFINVSQKFNGKLKSPTMSENMVGLSFDSSAKQFTMGANIHQEHGLCGRHINQQMIAVVPIKMKFNNDYSN